MYRSGFDMLGMNNIMFLCNLTPINTTTSKLRYVDVGEP